MANIYWINTAGGNWATVANWSIPSDSTPRRVPTSTDIVFFNAASGTSATVSSIGASIIVAGLDCTGFPGEIKIGAGFQLTVKGNVTLSASPTAKYTGATLLINPTATITNPLTPNTITTNGATLECTPVKFVGTGPASNYNLVGALTCKSTFAIVNCTLNFNGNVITCGVLGGGNTIGIGTIVFNFGASGTSAIVIPTGGGTANTTVVDLGTGVACSSSSSGSQRPVIRLTYAGATGSRKVVDPWGAFDYVWSGADLSNSLALSCRNLDLSNFTGSMLMASNIGISGDLTFNTATKWIASGSFAVTFNGTGTQNIDTKGVGLDCVANFGSTTTTGTYVIQNNLALGGISRTTTLVSGTLNLNGKTLTVFNFNSSNTTVRSIAFAAGKIISGGTSFAWIATTGTNLSITGPGSIELTNVTTTRIFDGGSVVYSGITLLLSGVSTSSIIRGSNSFFSIKNTASPQAIYFTQNTTTTFTDNFELNGTAGTGNNIFITSAGVPANLAAAPNFAKPSGSVLCSYANISWNNAGYTGTPPGTGPTAAYTSTWAIGVGSVLTPNQTSGWTKSAGTAGFITFFYP